jgi:hypothetical protein
MRCPSLYTASAASLAALLHEAAHELLGVLLEHVVDLVQDRVHVVVELFLALGNGLLYAYTKPKLATANEVDAWYFTAIDIRTGRTVWSRLTGTGIQWNNHYAAIYLGPDGAAYIATLAGLVRITDG